MEATTVLVHSSRTRSFLTVGLWALVLVLVSANVGYSVIALAPFCLRAARAALSSPIRLSLGVQRASLENHDIRLPIGSIESWFDDKYIIIILTNDTMHHRINRGYVNVYRRGIVIHKYYSAGYEPICKALKLAEVNRSSAGIRRLLYSF